ncbi:MAG: MoaD/ThiS family protein [Alphaproteobacteria bacterium]|nr:MoaD/ThiS family protein [Alphaproteobacteria bacterium]
MARVAFTGNLKRHVACPAVDVAGASVRAVLESVFAGNARLRSYVFDDQDRLRRHVNVYVNEKRADLDDPVGPRDEVFVFQSLAGG